MGDCLFSPSEWRRVRLRDVMGDVSDDRLVVDADAADGATLPAFAIGTRADGTQGGGRQDRRDSVDRQGPTSARLTPR